MRCCCVVGSITRLQDGIGSIRLVPIFVQNENSLALAVQVRFNALLAPLLLLPKRSGCQGARQTRVVTHRSSEVTAECAIAFFAEGAGQSARQYTLVRRLDSPCTGRDAGGPYASWQSPFLKPEHWHCYAQKKLPCLVFCKARFEN